MERKIVAVLVTYYPDIDHLKSSIKKLIDQGSYVCVVNNSSQDVEVLSAQVINLGENKGIAYAQNVGMELAFNSFNADFVIQMDQDSLPADDMVQKLLTAYDYLTAHKINVGLVGCQDIDKDSLIGSKPRINKGKIILNQKHLIEVSEVLSSGSLIPRATYQTVGGPDNRLFIDIVDFEYCWRIATFGYKVVKSTEAIVFHKLGEGQKKIFGLISVVIPKPFRHYYNVRNAIYLIIYGKAPVYWKISNTAKILFKLCVYPFTLPEGKKRFKFIVKGISDGIYKRFEIING